MSRNNALNSKCRELGVELENIVKRIYSQTEYVPISIASKKLKKSLLSAIMMLNFKSTYLSPTCSVKIYSTAKTILHHLDQVMQSSFVSSHRKNVYGEFAIELIKFIRTDSSKLSKTISIFDPDDCGFRSKGLCARNHRCKWNSRSNKCDPSLVPENKCHDKSKIKCTEDSRCAWNWMSDQCEESPTPPIMESSPASSFSSSSSSVSSSPASSERSRWQRRPFGNFLPYRRG